MDTIICNNRVVAGIKTILMIGFLFICFSCIFFPVVFYSFIIRLKNEINSELIIFGITSLFSLVFVISTFIISMTHIFGKIYIVLNNSKIIVNQYVFGICRASKRIPLTDNTRILLESGPSDSSAYIFRDNGIFQIIQMDPVVYSIKIQRLDNTDVVFSSGNYSQILKLFEQICGRYPELKSEIDISSEKNLLSEHRKKSNYRKKQITLFLSFFCACFAMVTGLALYLQYVDYKYSKNWIKVQGRIEEVQKNLNEEQLRISYYWGDKKLYTPSDEKNSLSRYGKDFTKGNMVCVFVNPENPKQCTLGSVGLSNMIDIIIIFCLSLIFSISAFCYFLKIKRKINDKI